jgi:wyosine [tRNA(Phe)-imidazoG37] synthetase (radical SAM superfamily)
MKVTGEHIEALRSQLKLSIKEFCGKLEIDLADYALLMSANDAGQLPSSAGKILCSIMRGEEEKNVLAYRDKYPPEPPGYFSSTKILQHLDRLYQLEHAPREAGPITVEFHPTMNICQHSCPACTFGTNRRGGPRAEFDMRLLKGLIDDLKRLDVRGIDISGGGEPLCHKEIGKIVNSFAAKFDTGLVTNGYGLSDKDDSDSKRELRAAILKCTWCRISVDAGSQDVYRLMHGDKPHVNFDDIVYKIKLLAADKIKTGSDTTLGISFLLTPYNFFDLIPSIAIFREIEGLDYFQIKPVVIAPSERIDAGMVFWDERLFEVLGSIKDFETESFKIFTLSYKFADMLLRGESGLPFQKCRGHPFYPTVSADGSVLVCCHMLNNLLDGKKAGIYGRITEDVRFIDIWNSESRWKVGEGIQVASCPCNCKLSETNKTLESLHSQKVMHKNFIN